MANIITKEAVGTALGVGDKVAKVGGETTLDQITKALTILDKPLVNKYLDRILNRIPQLKEEVPKAPTPAEVPAPTDKRTTPPPAPAPTPTAPKQKFPKGAEIIEFFEGSMAQLAKDNPKMTVAELVGWLNANKKKLAKVIDFAVVSGIFTE